MSWRQYNLDTARRLRVRWKAQSWQPPIVAADRLMLSGKTGSRAAATEVCRGQVRFVRPVVAVFWRKKPRRIRPGTTHFVNRPPWRGNNSSTTSL